MAINSVMPLVSQRTFDPYNITEIEVFTDRELGKGSYGMVVELEYKGLKCAGKKLHQLLRQQDPNGQYAEDRFVEECHLLSETKHPNIVQFLGVCFHNGEQFPMLVMEFLPTNLTSCVEKYGVLPKEINYSILHDVSLGLNYLHTQTPPIIHRDLSSNNVLLTPNMTAKISDLGVARILNLTPMQMTGTPGTPAFMPPEVMVADPRYDTSLDIFSYGVMMIHLFSGEWPVPKCAPVSTESDGDIIPVSEAKRREEYLHNINQQHPEAVMELILRCISNYSDKRGSAAEISSEMKGIVEQFPLSFANKVEMMSRIKALEEENKCLQAEIQEKNEQIDHKIEQVKGKEKEIENLKKNHQQSIERQEVVHGSEVEQLQSQVHDLNTEIEMLNSKIIASEAEKNQRGEALNESETCIHNLQAKVANLTSEVMEQKLENEQLKSTLSSKEQELITKEREIQFFNKNVLALEKKDSTISRLNDQLRRTRDYLSSRPQALKAEISWEECANLPVSGTSGGNAIIIKHKVYFGGFASGGQNENVVHCYDPSQDNWSTLPPLPIRWFGLGRVKEKLVAVGGKVLSNGNITNTVRTFSEKSRKWKLSLPPMPTARLSPAIICHSTALIAAGGWSMSGCAKVTEVYKINTSQWYTTNSLPIPFSHLSKALVLDKCYLIGGYKSQSQLNKVVSASVDQLLASAIPISQTSQNSAAQTPGWEQLANTPSFRPTAAVVSGTILAIGGSDDSTNIQNTVHMYTLSTDSWIYIGDMPAPLCDTVTALISPSEFLTIGGWDGTCRVNAVYKATLNIAL